MIVRSFLLRLDELFGQVHEMRLFQAYFGLGMLDMEAKTISLDAGIIEILARKPSPYDIFCWCLDCLKAGVQSDVLLNCNYKMHGKMALSGGSSPVETTIRQPGCVDFRRRLGERRGGLVRTVGGGLVIAYGLNRKEPFLAGLRQGNSRVGMKVASRL